MIFKILMLLLVAAGLIYWIKQPRGGTPYSPYPTARPRRPVFIALCIAAALSVAASLMTFLLWAGGVAGGVTGGGYRGQGDFLLPGAGTRLALAVVGAVGAFFNRRG